VNKVFLITNTFIYTQCHFNNRLFSNVMEYIKKKALRAFALKAMNKKSLAATYSSTLLCAVPSAMKGLTSEFGMGSGISPSLMPPSENLVNLFHL
jgi:hypothetical protein